MAKYHLSLIDLQWVAARLAGEMAGRLEREFAERCRRWVEKDVLPLVVPGAREKIEKHRAEGHVLAILSTSPTLRHRAARRGAGHRGGDLDPVRGSRTGCSPAGCVGPACVGQGKVHWAEDLGARTQLDLAKSWFYTDSYTDMPMLERVGNQVVVNPDPRLQPDREAARLAGAGLAAGRRAAVAAEEASA